jgi:hypothetical protein
MKTGQTIISNSPKAKGREIGWAFQDGRKAHQAAKKHGVDNPQKKQS